MCHHLMVLVPPDLLPLPLLLPHAASAPALALAPTSPSTDLRSIRSDVIYSAIPSTHRHVRAEQRRRPAPTRTVTETFDAISPRFRRGCWARYDAVAGRSRAMAPGTRCDQTETEPRAVPIIRTT